jgi:two-component system, OmpR family, response regulator
MDRKKKILVVDDDPNIRELISVNLRAAGYDVLNAENGQEALGAVKLYIPDLVVLDIMMPQVDGWEVCKYIRDNSELEHIKIVMLTAKGTEKDKMIGRDIFRADDYMTKPFDIDELKMVIMRHLHD